MHAKLLLLVALHYVDGPRQGNTDGGHGAGSRWGDSDSDGEGDSNSDDCNDGDDDDSNDDKDNDVFSDDVTILRNFSFISANKDGKTLEMHRLVQLATLEWLEAHGQQDHWRHRFLRRLCARLPTGEYENWAECQALFPHAKSAAAHAPKEEESLRDWATILYNTKWFNLQSCEGRRIALCHVLSLLRYETEGICCQVNIMEDSDQSSSYFGEGDYSMDTEE